MNETMGDRMRYAREMAGLTQKQVARELGLSDQSRVSQYETQSDVRWTTIVKLANLYDVSPKWIQTGEVADLTMFEPMLQQLKPNDRAKLTKLLGAIYEPSA